MEQCKENQNVRHWPSWFCVWLCSSLPRLQTCVMHDLWRFNTPGMSLRLARCCSSSRRACAMLASVWMTRRCPSILIGVPVLSKIPLLFGSKEVRTSEIVFDHCKYTFRKQRFVVDFKNSRVFDMFVFIMWACQRYSVPMLDEVKLHLRTFGTI